MNKPEIKLNIESAVIEAKTRKLKATWTMEAADVLRNSFPLPEDTFMQELQKEIDQEVLNDLKEQAAINAIKQRKKKKYRSIDEPFEPN